tara:strand:- start:11 stop:919 length:909 start_codon:yes stop_codon:yes gene_type:complete
MRVALYDVDSKIPNLALMKLARFHRERGDEVVRFDPAFPLEHGTYEQVYASKVFKFSTSPYLASNKMMIGGSGWDLGVTLPAEIEALRPDYALYPDFDGNLGFAMRGCRFQCKFCVVPEKEGRPRSNGSIADLLVNDSDFLYLLDNDFFGNPEWPERIGEIRARGLRVNFSQGINIRVLTEKQAEALASVRFVNPNSTKKQVTFAWDRPRDERLIYRGIERCKAAGIKPWAMQFFVLIGFDTTPEEDLHRVRSILAVGADPYAMPYNKADAYQKAFARWVNGRICRTVPWEAYSLGGWNRAA